MKKIFILFICIAIFISIMCSCTNNTAQSDSTDTNNPVSYISNIELIYDNETTVNDGAFLVKSKKYTLNEKNVFLLDIENKSNKNYTLTVSVTYFDTNGNELKNEVKSFEGGFAAGLRNGFIFQPGIIFDNAEFTLFAEDFTGDCVINDLLIEWKGFDEITIMGNTDYIGTLSMKNISDLEFKIQADIILFDETNNIISVGSIGQKLTSGYEGNGSVAFATLPEGTEFWNKKHLDNYSYMICLNKVTIVEK